MAEYVNPDDPDGTIGEQMRARVRHPAGRHALRPPSATRYEPVVPPVAEAAPAGGSATRGRAVAYGALALSLALSVAQGVVGDPSLLTGLPESISGPVLSTAQLLLVFAAAYRARPALSPTR